MLLTGDELSSQTMQQIILHAISLKQDRHPSTHLKGKHLALLFDKPSLRTRFSFTVAMRELGGDVIESLDSTRKYEEPEDTAQVLQGYVHAIVVRTHADSTLQRMAKVSQIPIINGLSNLHHPCQALADFMTLQETFNHLPGLTLAYVGDGNNVLNSLLLLAPKLDININFCCPPSRQPLNPSLGNAFTSPQQAVVNADAIYTDVWTSMGFENQTDESLFSHLQVNETLLSHAPQHAIIMHCLPMIRGKEISQHLPNSPQSAIFQQSTNRLHTQKALLLHLLAGGALRTPCTPEARASSPCIPH